MNCGNALEHRRFSTGCADLRGDRYGEELIARALHRNSSRASAVFVALDCGSLSDTLSRANCSDRGKGAFTGATKNRPGLIDSADGGVLFLDEISNLPLRLNPNSYGFLQEREVRRIGEVVPRKLDIRVIAATNKDLQKEIQKGKFRGDLYLSFSLEWRRLESRRSENEGKTYLSSSIRFLARIVQGQGQTKHFSGEAFQRLINYSAPGNGAQPDVPCRRCLLCLSGEVDRVNAPSS